LNGRFSDYFANNIGVMQGTILSPLLFSLYINNIETSFISNGTVDCQFDDLSLILLVVKDTTDSPSSASYLDLYLEHDINGTLTTKHLW